MNDAATIRVFIKGLKNVHSLATHIYEIRPQTLTDAISKVEKHNAVQQLTATIIPPSTVNMMSNEEDHCFQCQEQGHIVWNYLILNASSVMSMITLSWIVQTRYLLQEPQQLIPNPNLTEATMPDQGQGATMKTGTGQVDPDHNLIFEDITAWVVTVHTEATHGHSIRIITATTEAAHNIHAPPIQVTAIDPTMTHPADHIMDHPHIEVLQLTTPEIVVDHVHDHPTNLQGETHTDQVHIPADHEANHTLEESEGENWRSKLRLLQLWWTLQWLRRGSQSFKLSEPSQSSDSHEHEGLSTHNQVTVALIMDCPTITIHAR